MKRTGLTAYVYMLPYVIIVVCLIIFPFIWNVSLSFESDNSFLSNYQEKFSDIIFGKVFSNTLIWTFFSVFFQLIIGLNIAILLNQKIKGIALFRALILILPWAIPDIVAAIAWKWMYNDLYGVFNDILLRFNIINRPIAWLGNISLAMPSIIVANIWKGFAMSAMFYLAALQSINNEIIEAAKVDGANNFAIYRHLLLPHLQPTIISTVILTIIFTINYFPLIFSMTGGGPYHSTDTLVTWSYQLGFRFLKFNESATVSTINFLFILIFSIAYSYIFFRKEKV
jgi:multiple sugar transport system permease protein